MSSFATRITARLEKHAGAVLPRLPDQVVRRLAGKPIVIDGRTLEPRIQIAAKTAQRKAPISTVGIKRARAAANASLAAGNGRRAAGVEVADSSIPNGLRVRTYRAGPPSTADSKQSAAMLFMHQGGFVIGDLDTCDSFCARVAADLKITVVSLDYRLAPEHKFPAQVDDALAAWSWMQAEASTLGIDQERVVIAGDSAGGHLSALMCQRLLDAGQPMPAAQLLVYPFVDGAAGGGSMDSCAQSYPLDRDTMDWFGEQYMPEGLDPTAPSFSPAAADLAGLPSAIVVTAGFDPLRDQGMAYAAALRSAGVEVIDRCEDVLSHSFLSLDGVVPEAKAAHLRLIDDLRTTLWGTTSADR